MITRKDLNSISLTGWLGSVPELRYLADGQAVCELSIGVHDEVRQSDGTYADVTDWFKLSQYGQAAEFCTLYLVKGSRVAVSGRLKVERYLDKQHQSQFRLLISEATITPLDRKPSDDGPDKVVPHTVVEAKGGRGRTVPLDQEILLEL